LLDGLKKRERVSMGNLKLVDYFSIMFDIKLKLNFLAYF
jgi:hypothetical protein